MNRSILLLCVLGLLLPGCAGMSAQGRKVETVGPGQVVGMKFLGNVAASSPLAGWAMKDVSYQNALNKALNEAGQLGATHLVLEAESGPRFWGINQSVRGKAYREDASRRREGPAMGRDGSGTLYMR